MPMQPMNAQWFPIYYPMGPKAFQDADGNPSGAIGAVAELTKDISNFPIMFWGLRITNIYALPNAPAEIDLRTFEACKRYIDDEQSVRLELSQQNVTAEATVQTQLVGKSGIYWAPFPEPYPMEGGNNIAVTITRLSSYPLLNGEPILPVVRASIVATVARDDRQTIPSMRREILGA